MQSNDVRTLTKVLYNGSSDGKRNDLTAAKRVQSCTYLTVPKNEAVRLKRRAIYAEQYLSVAMLKEKIRICIYMNPLLFNRTIFM